MARVLVVDDDELFVKLMCHSLKQKGHEVEFALDGDAGWKTFNQSKFDVVICDIVMPEQEGIETIKRMRKSRPDIGIIAISGGLSLSHAAKIDVLDIVQKLGADATLKKPFQLSELNATVDRVLTGPRAEAV